MSDEAEWWEDDAERINAMAELAKDKAVKVIDGKTPALNADGSLKVKALGKVAHALKGGSGSGNYGHQGIPGHVGGSTAGADKGGGGIGGSNMRTATGPTEVLNAVSQPSHPMYRAYMHGDTNFESEYFARVNFSQGRNAGQYLLTREGNKFEVNGQPKGTSKKLLKKFNSVPEAIEAMEDHFAGRTVNRIATNSAEWFKKYPETKTLQDDKKGKLGKFR
jgi:hypothetical protein